jgi:hypothetical protein
MGKKKTERENEFYVRCPLYLKKLDGCPSSVSILMDNDFDTLTKSCLSEQYVSCQLFCEQKDKSQAA